MRHLLLILMMGFCVACSANGNASSTTLIPALEKLAAEKNAEAMYHLGMAYHTGSGVKRDYKKAFRYFQNSAHFGDPLGAYKLGCYYDGQGEGQVERDVEKGLKYKIIAADSGYALAQQDVARVLAKKGEYGGALKWLEKASAQGWPDALMAYASIHNGAEGIEPDPVKTAAYFTLFLERVEGSEGQKDWLRKFEDKLKKDQRERATRIVSDYKASPSTLTLKALSGQRAAEKLARTSN